VLFPPFETPRFARLFRVRCFFRASEA